MHVPPGIVWILYSIMYHYPSNYAKLITIKCMSVVYRYQCEVIVMSLLLWSLWLPVMHLSM